MLKKFHQIIAIIEVIVYILSISILTYFSGKNNWKMFFSIALICIILFLFLQIIRTKPILNKLKLLEEMQFQLVKRTQEFGISNIYNMREIYEQNERNSVTREIIKRGNVFSLVSLTAASYIDTGLKRHWDILKLKLDEGVPFRLLLMNPFCKEKEIRDKLNSISTPYDSKFRLDIIIELYNKYPNVNIRISSNNIYCAVFFSENEMIYDPYHVGKIEDRIENYFLSLKIDKMEKENPNSKQSYFNILKQHFEYLWNTADEFEMFLDKYKEYLGKSQSNSLNIKPRYDFKRGDV